MRANINIHGVACYYYRNLSDSDERPACRLSMKSSSRSAALGFSRSFLLSIYFCPLPGLCSSSSLSARYRFTRAALLVNRYATPIGEVLLYARSGTRISLYRMLQKHQFERRRIWQISRRFFHENSLKPRLPPVGSQISFHIKGFPPLESKTSFRYPRQYLTEDYVFSSNISRTNKPLDSSPVLCLDRNLRCSMLNLARSRGNQFRYDLYCAYMHNSLSALPRYGLVRGSGD